MDAAAASAITPHHVKKVRQTPRRLLFLLVLVLLLAGLIAARRWTADWHFVVSGEPGEVLYTATFDDFLADWDVYQGRLEAQTVDGVLRLRAEAGNSGPFSVARPHFADFDFSAQTQVVDGPLNNGFGVIFRLQDKGNTSLADDSYYLFLVSSDGYYQVKRVVNGESKDLSVWIPSPLINQGIGAVNHLRVMAVGDEFRFWVNGSLVELCVPDNPDGSSTYDDIRGECIGGQMLDVLTDASIATGQLGAVVVTFNEPNVAVEFDNVLVVMPGE